MSSSNSAPSLSNLFPDFEDNKTIFVSGLTNNVTDSLLSSVVMEKFPTEVVSIHVTKNESHFDTPIAYINMSTHDAAKRVISTLNGVMVDGKPINMFWALKDFKQRTDTQTNLFVKNIKKSVNQKELQDVFSAIGETLSVKLSLNEKGESNGFGYVKYRTLEATQAALDKSDEPKAKIGEETFVVQKFEKQNKSRKTNLYVYNIDKKVTEEQFIKYFETFGPIRKTSDKKPQVLFVSEETKDTAKGFVDFENEEDAAKAVSAPKNSVLGNGEIVVAYYKNKEERRREWKVKTAEVKANIKGKYKDFNLYVDTLKESITEKEIREGLGEEGEIYSLSIRWVDRKPTGVAYLCYTTAEGANNAIVKGTQLGWKVFKFLNKQEIAVSDMAYGNFMNQAFLMSYINYFQQLTSLQPYQKKKSNGPRRERKDDRSDRREEKGGRRDRDDKRHERTEKQEKVETKVEKKEEKKDVKVEAKPDQITEDMRNELGENLFLYVEKYTKADEEKNGRITGVLLDSIKFEQLKAMLNNEDKKDINGVIDEVIETLKKI
uniref:Polyadenylate-binding protein, cytoplasmic and nuclear, putative n=1 Tax=Entamoeba invadens TaxID=33085 RepID=S0AXY0_ENTIV|nr:polyadenylate-binding protein, cytoplasmic and nuclear, putative [Entamoeba invadens]